MGDWKKTIDKRTYLKKLLSFLTSQEFEVFNMVFPAPSKNVDGAIELAERHFRGQLELREKNESLSAKLRDLESEIKEMDNSMRLLSSENEGNIRDKKRISKRLSIALEVVDKDSLYVKKRLAKLDALEIGGVDNWEWYSESLQNAGWSE